MNKYKASYNFIELCVRPWEHGVDELDRPVMNTQKQDNMSILKELVDKATPMKVEKVISDSDITIGNLTIRKGTMVIQKCPKCGEIIMEVHNKKYCGNCGQAIDWSNEDE